MQLAEPQESTANAVLCDCEDILLVGPQRQKSFGRDVGP